MTLHERLFRIALFTCPKAFRDEFGEQATSDFVELAAEAKGSQGAWGGAAVCTLGILDVLRTAWRERRTRQQGRSTVIGVPQHFHDARRSLAATPALTAIVILTIALGIGATSAIFEVVYEVILKSLPFPNERSLVMLYETDVARGIDRNDAAPANFEDWRDRNTSFAEISAMARTSMNLTDASVPERLAVQRVSSNFFPLLGVVPALGRGFASEEDSPDGGRVAILTHGLWTRRFGSRRDVLNDNVVLDDVPHRIIGVLPRWFHFPSRDTQLFVPLAMHSEEKTARSSHYLDVFGRLDDGVSLAQASDELGAIAASLAAEYPETNTDNGVAVYPLRDELVRGRSAALLLILAAVGAVLLIAVVNIANLLMAKSASRQKEMAIRSALGASRTRIMELLLAESLLVSSLGGILGVTLGAWAKHLLISLTPEHVALGESWLQPQAVVFGIILAVAIAAAIGCLPALQLSRLGQGSLVSLRGVRCGLGVRTRRFLVVAEVALAVVLLIAGGLMIRSFVELTSLSPGFRVENILTMHIELSGARYREHHQKLAFYRELHTRATRLPGVVSAGFVTALPLTFQGGSILFGIENPSTDLDMEPVAVFRSVSSEYFRTLGIPLLEGRGFEAHDDDRTPRVAIVNEHLARRFFSGGRVVGERLDIWGESAEIIGVVGNVVQFTLGAESRPAIYVASDQRSMGFFDPKDFSVRVVGDPLALADIVRDEVWAIDPDQPIASLRTMEEIVSGSVANERLQTRLLSVFGTAALLLAALGIYGVLSHVVAQRTEEIGLRMAMGARTLDVLRMIAGQGMLLALIGIGVGVPAALGLGRILSGLLHGVPANDPWTFLAITILLGIVALAACLIPAARAARIDPLVALRKE